MPCCVQVDVGPEVQAPELTNELFHLGGHMLLRWLPAILSGRAAELAVPQDEAHASHAPKVCHGTVMNGHSPVLQLLFTSLLSGSAAVSAAQVVLRRTGTVVPVQMLTGLRGSEVERGCFAAVKSKCRLVDLAGASCCAR